MAKKIAPSSKTPSKRHSSTSVPERVSIPMSVFNASLLEANPRNNVYIERSNSLDVRSTVSKTSRRQPHHHFASVSIPSDTTTLTANNLTPSSTTASTSSPFIKSSILNNNKHHRTPHLQQAPKRSLSTRSYKRPIGPLNPSLTHPSCSHLPATWSVTHDKFIAYLATHAPLDSSGKVPRGEERKERWTLGEMALLLNERFGELRGCKIRASTIEKRLTLLDLAGDNDYFKMGYGAYRNEVWGTDI